MLARIPNEKGVITYSKNAVEDVVRSAFSRCKQSCWVSRFTPGARELSFSDKGVYLRVAVIVRVGTPIRATLADIIGFISRNITDCLELPVDNIVLNVVGVAGAKNTLKRDITLDFYGNYVNPDDGDSGDEE